MLNKMDFMNKFSNVHEGMSVYSQDGENLGKILSMDQDSFTVEKGFFFPKDFTARYDDIIGIDNDQIILNRQTAELSDWRDESYSGWREVDQHDTSDTPYQTSGVFGIGPTGNLRDSSSTQMESPSREMDTSQDKDDISITLSEEQLQARKNMQQTGEVRLRKIVHTEHKSITVPVMKEEVSIERTPVSDSRAGEFKDSSFEEETVSMPVMEENVELLKRPVVKEEVHLHKDRRVEQETFSGDVRSEEVEIDKPTKRKAG